MDWIYGLRHVRYRESVCSCKRAFKDAKLPSHSGSWNLCSSLEWILRGIKSSCLSFVWMMRNSRDVENFQKEKAKTCAQKQSFPDENVCAAACMNINCGKMLGAHTNPANINFSSLKIRLLFAVNLFLFLPPQPWFFFVWIVSLNELISVCTEIFILSLLEFFICSVWHFCEKRVRTLSEKVPGKFFIEIRALGKKFTNEIRLGLIEMFFYEQIQIFPSSLSLSLRLLRLLLPLLSNRVSNSLLCTWNSDSGWQ